MVGRLARGVKISAWAAALGAALLLATAFLPTLVGYESLIVTSGSMEPGIPVGSVALTRPILVTAVTVGDVVSFRRPGRKDTITHRVAAVERQGDAIVLTTRGDANGSNDTEPISVRGRIHRVEHVVPYAGYAVRYARSPLGAVVLFLIPILGLSRERWLQAHPPRRRMRGTADDAGWSATTFAFVRVTPRAIRSDPGS